MSNAPDIHGDFVNPNAVAKPQAPKRSLLAAVAERYDMEPLALERTLRGTLMPQNTTNEAMAAFLLVANEHKLNPFTREIFAFPDSKSGGIRPIVSVDGWAKLVNNHPQCDGFELIDVFTESGVFDAVEARIYRKDRQHPVMVREYLVECDRGTEPWKRWPRRMLRHKAFIQAARLAFSFSGIEDEDEYERTIEVQADTAHRPPLTTKHVVTMDLSAARSVEPRDPPGGSSFNAPSDPVLDPEADRRSRQ